MRSLAAPRGGAELTRRTTDLSTLYEVSRILGEGGDLPKALTGTLRILHSFLGLADGAVLLQDRGGGPLRVAASLAPPPAGRSAPPHPPESLADQILRHGLPLVVPGDQEDRLRAGRGGTSLLGVPIKAKGVPVGVLLARRDLREAPASLHDDLRVLTVVAGLIGQAVHAERQAELPPIPPGPARGGARGGAGPPGPSRVHSGIVGQSKGMQEVFEAVARVSPSQATVLLRGESGTGKELIARAIHQHGPRAEGPFIKLNCAALPEPLLESELFGHERGAFTGAVQARKGRFELADRGTIFLDEIGDVPLGTQAKLLRAIQEKRFERLGGTRTLTVDVRIIAATNRNLERAMAEGAFREDLYYRLNVLPIFLPPLRSRREDIPALVEHFLARFNAENGKRVRVTGRTLQAMLEYPWPGNVRELENVLERLVVLTSRSLVLPEDLPSVITTAEPGSGVGGLPAGAVAGLPAGGVAGRDPREGWGGRPLGLGTGDSGLGTGGSRLRDVERQAILDALERAGGVQARAAEVLGITPRQIRYRLRKFGIARRYGPAA